MKLFLYKNKNILKIAWYNDSDKYQLDFIKSLEHRELSEEEALAITNGVSEHLPFIGDKNTTIQGDDIKTCIVTRSHPDNFQNSTRVIEIQQQLYINDLKSIRPLRAKLRETATAEDDVVLQELEEQSQTLRDELHSLKLNP